MNKKGFLKVLMVGFIVSMAIGFLGNQAMAQVMPTQITTMSEYGMLVGDSILLDNFEYWNSPRNMGWKAIEPAYPVYGAGIGYGELYTTLDFEEGSRVFDVYRLPSAFLPFSSMYMPFTVQKAATVYTDGNGVEAIPSDYNNLSFKVRAPLAIEQFDTFSFTVLVETADDTYAQIQLIPRDKTVGCAVAKIEDTVDEVGDSFSDKQSSPTLIKAYIGRQFADFSWHLVMVDLAAVVDKASGGDGDLSNAVDNGGEALKNILAVVIRGNQYRLDDITFTKDEAMVTKNKAPYLFRIGPVYATIWNLSDMRFIYAEDEDLNMHLVKNDDDELVFPNIVDAAGVHHGDAGFDPNTAEFVNNNKGANLSFRWTVGGSLGTMATRLATALPVDPNNIPLMYFPKMGAPMNEWVWNKDADGDGVADQDADNPMYVLAKALKNTDRDGDGEITSNDYPVWPNVQVLMPSQSQVLESMIVTCRISDGLGFDMETFPLTVVNYDVTNLPPLIEQLEDQIFTVGERTTYQINATDPDPQDMGGLTYRATINGLSSYTYGPWNETIIDPCRGTLGFTPQFEGTFTCMVTVSDPRGAYAVGSFTIFCVNPGTWLNHPPVVKHIIESPQSVRAGQTFIISDLQIVDPDNQPLYYSCNIGSVGANGVYSFQSLYPGQYMVQITAYDILGGAVTQAFVLNVIPMWAY